MFSGKVEDQHVPYMVPSENGGKADVRWMALRRGEGGAGLLLQAEAGRVFEVGTGPLSLSALAGCSAFGRAHFVGSIDAINSIVCMSHMFPSVRSPVPSPTPLCCAQFWLGCLSIDGPIYNDVL